MALGHGLDQPTAVGVDRVRHPVADGGDGRAQALLFQTPANLADDRLPTVVGLDGKEAALGLDDEAVFQDGC